MKTKLLFSLILTIIFSIVLSCASAPLPELTTEHEGLIGTKWLSVVSGSGDTLVFNDRTFCTFTTNGKAQQMRYTLKDKKIIMGNNLLSYELRGDEIYLIGYPAYNKA